MSDHWNSLADLLGTPSIDPLQRKTSPPAKREKESSQPLSEKATSPKAESVIAEKAKPSERDESFEPDVIAAKAEHPSRLRSSWDTVARLFGVVTGSDASPATETSIPETSHASDADTKSDDDVFAGFGRKPERNRSDEIPRKPTVREPAVREPSRPKKPSSFWSTPEPHVDEPPPTRNHPQANAESPVPVDRTMSDDESSGAPERRGRTRNIRRGRGMEAEADAPREVPDSPDATRDRVRSESRNDAGPRRGERSERSPEGNRSDRGERSERSPDRQPSDRQPSDRQASDRQASDRQPTDRPAPDRKPRGGDRPPRDAERRPRGEDRVARTGDRPVRGDKRSSETDDVPSTRSSERPSRNENPASAGEGRDRPARGRGPRRESEPVVDDEGEWDSSEVVFDRDDEVSDREVLPAISEDGDPPAPAPRRRRRRRGSRRDESSERDEPLSDDVSSKQAYGRQVEEEDVGEEVENLRIHKVTSWLDAISTIIDSNMENHKRNPGQDRGRGGQRGGGNARRRGSGGSSGSR